MKEMVAMKGWKTWAGAAGLLVGAVAGYATGHLDPTAAWAMASAALTAVGLGHKIEKITG